MVTLVLEDNGSEALDGLGGILHACSNDILCKTVLPEHRLGIGNVDFLISVHASTPSRHGQTAFLSGDLLSAYCSDADIRIHLERLSFLVQTLDCDDTAVDSDLRAGDTDTVLLRRGHGRNHAYRESCKVRRLYVLVGHVCAFPPEHFDIFRLIDGEHPHEEAGLIYEFALGIREWSLGSFVAGSHGQGQEKNMDESTLHKVQADSQDPKAGEGLQARWQP